MDGQATTSTSQPQQGQSAPRKKRKIEGALPGIRHGKKNAGGHTGARTNLLEMPLDILFEIFILITPLELLDLIQTNKAIRKLLLNRSSRFVWKHSYQNVEPPLPTCPDNMSEPAFAEFMLGKGCHLCHRKVQDTFAWGCQFRACKKCLKIHFTNEGPNITYDLGSLKLIPPFISAGIYKPNRRLYWTELNQKWKEEFLQLPNVEERREWYEQKTKYIADTEKHGKICKDWVRERKKVLAKDEKLSREDRKAAVLLHLRQLGWGGELDKLKEDAEKLQNLSEVELACRKPLTGRALKELRPVLTEFMEGVKSARLDLERQAFLKPRLSVLLVLYEDYLQSQPATFEYANIADVFQSPAVQNIINDSTSPDLTELDRSRLTAAFPQAQDAWKTSVKDQLLRLVLKATAKGDSPASSLVSLETMFSDPSIFFLCGVCAMHIPARDMEGHLCPRFARPSDERKKKEGWTSEDKALLAFTAEFRWNASQVLAFHPDVTERVALVLKKFNCYQKSNDLDDVDPILECLACHSEQSGRFMMTWRSLANHFWDCKNIVHDVDKHFRLVKEPDVSVVRSRIAEDRAILFAKSTNPGYAMCKHCRVQQTYTDLLQHTRTKHFIVQPKLGTDIITSPYFVGGRGYHHHWPPLSQEEVDALVAE